MKDRVAVILLALVAQLAVSAVLMPWGAASETELFSGAKMALAIGLLANVLVRLTMMRWAAGMPASRTRARTARGAGRGKIGDFWYVLIAFAFAIVSTSVGATLADSRLFDATAVSLVCVLFQQIVLATIAFNIQQRTARSRGSRTLSLLAIGAVASFFALVVPSLFRQIDPGQVVQNVATDVVFAVPVILIALVGIVRSRLSGFR